MPGQILHPIDEIIGKALWSNRSLGSNPAPWQASFEGKGTVPVTTWPVFSGYGASEPDNLIVVVETTPAQDTKIMVTGEQQQKYGFTIQVSGKTRLAVYRKARDIEWDFQRPTGGFIDQQVTLDNQQYLIPCIPHCIMIPLPKDAIAPGLWSVNLNCLANVLAYPIQG